LKVNQIHVSQGPDGAIVRRTIFTKCLYWTNLIKIRSSILAIDIENQGSDFNHIDIGQKSSPEPEGQFQSNFMQIIIALREYKFIQIKDQVLIKGEIITKIGWSYYKNLISQDLHEIFLTQRTIKLIKIMVPRGREGQTY
jgi:hypothetical protein